MKTLDLDNWRATSKIQVVHESLNLKRASNLPKIKPEWLEPFEVPKVRNAEEFTHFCADQLYSVVEGEEKAISEFKHLARSEFILALRDQDWANLGEPRIARVHILQPALRPDYEDATDWYIKDHSVGGYDLLASMTWYLLHKPEGTWYTIPSNDWDYWGNRGKPCLPREVRSEAAFKEALAELLESRRLEAVRLAKQGLAPKVLTVLEEDALIQEERDLKYGKSLWCGMRDNSISFRSDMYDIGFFGSYESSKRIHRGRIEHNADLSFVSVTRHATEKEAKAYEPRDPR